MAWTTPILQDERVLLRPLDVRDAESLWHVVQDPEIRRLTGTHRIFALDEIVAYCASRAEQTDRMTFAVADPSDREYWGEVVLQDHDAPNKSAGVRLALSSGSVGRGIGTAALRLVLAHAFGPLHLHRVSLEVFAFNKRAIHVYEKVGFRHEGTLRDAMWWEGVPYDTLIMAVLASEWRG
jgi:RimJ/RimL family protein N-acetyltransferase